MPLPIEVNHVLGRRSLTLAYRDVDAPITIGRGRDCDVQIPSVAVGAQHCMLFVHEGRWLLQETPSAIVTVNGAQIAGPVALQIGDVIGVGPGEKAPSIQIDPAGAAAGKIGPAVETGSAVVNSAGPAVIGAAPKGKVRPPRPTPIAGEAPPQLATPKARPSRPAVAPPPEPADEQPEQYAPADQTPAYETAESAGDTIDFGQAAAAVSSYRRRRPKPSSGAGALVVLFLVVVIGLSGLIWWAWQRHEAMLASLPHDQPAPAVVVVTTAPAPAPKPKKIVDNSADAGTSIFDIPGHHKPARKPAPSPATPRATPGDTNAPATPPTPPAPSTPTPAAAPPDNSDTANDDTDTDWQAIRAAHIGPDQADALVKYESYQQANPGKHATQIAKYENDAMEQLWWQRVLDLFNRRADLDKQIAKQKEDLSQQPEDDFKKQMRADLATMQQKRDAADQELTGKFGYTLPTPPDLDDSDALAQLDAKRDSDMFANWKKSTLKWIVEHNGKTPWADE